MSQFKLRPTRAFLKTLEFLQSGRLHLKDSVRNIILYYNTWSSESTGIRRFIAEKLPPVQFKNPNVQVLMFKNTKPTPLINIYFGDGKKVMLDVENKTADRILTELSAVAAKSEAQVQKDQQASEYNPANFGDSRRGRLCMCEVPGQVPCPSRVPIPPELKQHKWHDKHSRETDA